VPAIGRFSDPPRIEDPALSLDDGDVSAIRSPARPRELKLTADEMAELQRVAAERAATGNRACSRHFERWSCSA
jgi:hypothetical protein